MPTLDLKPTQKVVASYYDSLAKFAKLGIKYETAVRSAFQELLEHCARHFDWKLVPEYAIRRKGQADAKADGALLDNYGLNHGLWEAKDEADNLDKEIKLKFAAGYRSRYAGNLKRELPRIPFVGVTAKTIGNSPPRFFPLSAVDKMQDKGEPDHNPAASARLFDTFAQVGKRLADLHVNYGTAEEFPLNRRENKAVKLDWRVEAMKLSKDKTSLFYNDFLTLSGVPEEVYEYRLGNRSAFEWVIDQYRVSRDEQGKIANDPNRMDDEQYIVRLIGQVVTVSLETMKIVKSLPEVEK